MGTMIGDWRIRMFGNKIFHHYGISDSFDEAEGVTAYLKKGEISTKITGDRHGGANIWIRKKTKVRGSIRAILLILNPSYIEKMERMRGVKF